MNTNKYALFVTFTLFFLLTMVFLLILSLQFSSDARTVPLVVSGIAALLLLVKLYREICFVNTNNTVTLDFGVGSIRTLGWTIFLFSGGLIFGIHISGLIFLILYNRFEAKRTWIRSAIYALPIWLFGILLFEVILGIRLYAGIL